MKRRAHEAGRWVSLHVVLTGRALAQQLTCSSQASPCPARGEGPRRAESPQRRPHSLALHATSPDSQEGARKAPRGAGPLT